LKRVDLPNGDVIEYLVDGRNRRVGKKKNGVLVQQWLYRNQLNPVAELDGAGNIVARFVYGARHTPEYVIRGGAAYRILTDQLGSPRLVVDATTGAVVQRVRHDAFGVVLEDSGAGTVQPFGFAGGMYDAETGLVRFGARDYAPLLSRWTSRDPLLLGGDGPNLYQYVLGDPINKVDPSGECIPCIVAAVVGAFFASACDSAPCAAVPIAEAEVIKKCGNLSRSEMPSPVMSAGETRGIYKNRDDECANAHLRLAKARYKCAKSPTPTPPEDI
jgi:RHS repeat-associated protein